MSGALFYHSVLFHSERVSLSHQTRSLADQLGWLASELLESAYFLARGLQKRVTAPDF